MGDQLNFKQVPFDTMYYNNLTKQGGQVLIECDPNRTVLKIIESCISKNNTVLTDAELAQWIFRYYIARTKNHVERVKLCAMQLKEFFQFGGYFARFIAKVQQHDFDKFSGNEHVASYALNCPLYKYEDLYEITPESKRVYEEIEWPKHHQLNDHHPEHYMRRVDPEKDQWMITDDEMFEFFQDKGGHPAALMALGEMVADWSAVGMEMGDTATAWWLKNKDVHWSYGPKYTQALEACLAFSSNKLVVDDIEPLPEPPKKKVECSSESVFINPISDLEDVSLEKLFIKDEALFKAIKSAQKVTSKEKLASLLKPGDLLMVYRHLNNMHAVGKLFYNMSTRLQGSSFSSIKIIAQDPKYLYGYGVVMNETGFKKVSTKQFLSSCSGCLILRNTSLTQSQLDKLFKWLDDRVDKVEYSVLKLIQSVATHALGIADHVTKDQAVSYTSPMFCSTIFAYAMVATGINHGLGFSSISTVWPKDFATHSNWKPIYRYFERAEEADVVLEQQEPSAASYLPEVSTEGWFDPVAEEGMHYTIRNFPVLQFFNRLRKEYKTTKLEHLFEVIGIRLFSANRRTIVIHKFFIPELLYLLDKFAFPISLINTIKAHTWISDPAPRGMIFGGADLSFIEKTMTAELYPHQKEFIQNYQVNKKMNHLRGALLSFEQGLGKTITALALMQGLKKEHVVIVCPKNTMLETWNHHLIKFFKEPQQTWIINTTKGPLTSHYKWIIVNYEQLEYVKEFLMKNKLPNLGIIVDESHNFLRTSSVRTQLLVDLSKYNSDADILLLSGTPVKCAGVELIPMMSVLDPFFDEEAITIFKKTFGFNTAIANDVLNARLSRMMTRVTKTILDLPEKKESVVSVRMDTGWKYTASQVEKQIITFVKERQEYYNQNLHLYINAFEEVIAWLKGEPDISSQPEFQRYLSIIDYLRDANISDARGNADIVWANQYEINVLIPALPDNLKKQFLWSKSVVKYLPLKIKGEVIGQLLTRLRIQMTSEMMQAADLKQYVDKAMKKTIVFTSYVDTIELAYNYFKSNDYNPIAIYGKTASELTANVERFQTDQSLNPLIASLKMLSTGATLTAANTVIFLNKPWRSIEYQQASDRIHRIGQDTPCEIISLVLDTGKEANLSTRMEDIMQWSGDQFDQIVDKKEREMMKKFFRGFESLDIPEDCNELNNSFSENTNCDVISNELFSFFGDNGSAPISIKSLDKMKLQTLSKYSDLIEALDQWILVPDKRLLPKLIELGKIVDSIYSIKELTVYRGIDVGFMYKGKIQDTMGLTEGFFNTLKDGVGIGYTFKYGITKPLSTTTDVKIASAFGSVIVEGSIPRFVSKLVITDELSYLVCKRRNIEPSTQKECIIFPGSHITFKVISTGSQESILFEEVQQTSAPSKIVHNDPDLEECSGEQTGYIYWVESKEFLDDLYYATPEKPNDWNFVSYRQLPIAKKTEVKVSWHKKYDPDFAKNVKGGFMAVESMALLTSTPEERRLTNLAKPLYVSIGKNSWEHIQQDVGNAIDIIRTLQGRDLTLKEYAAILFHDCSVKARKSKDRHSYYSAEIARRILSKTTYFTSDDIDEICQAIEEHDEFINPNGIHSSDLSDLLASADCNPPNVAWILNKSYSRGMENGLTHEERIQNAVRYIPKKYGTHGTIVYPKMYAAFNKKAIIKMQQTFDTLTPEECERIIMDYRRRHGLKEGDLSLPDPSLESASNDPGLRLYHLSYGQPVDSKTLIPRIPDNESLSMEVSPSTPSKIAQKKKKILDFICKLCDTMEPSGLNSKRYRQIIGNMNDKEFDQFMNYMKEGKWQLHIVAPNMIVNLQNEDLLKACDMIGLDLFQKVWMYDRATGRKFLTDNKYMFVKLPIRRQQQFLDEKISVPDNDRTIDGLTGQVTGDSRSCSITNPEIQILAARGLDKTLKELVNVRGGNIHGYSEFRRMLEENGEADLDMIDPNSRTRASVVGGKLLQSMMLDTNL